jgi:uncharacterized protein (TIGR03437 family)
LFSGLVPGGVGLYQLNVLVPNGIPAGDQDLIVSFPSYTECCVVPTIALKTVQVDSKPVKIPLQ